LRIYQFIYAVKTVLSS